MRSMLPAVVSAVKRWAGPDQAQSLKLCEWLYHRLHTLRAFLEEGGQQQAGSGGGGAEGTAVPNSSVQPGAGRGFRAGLSCTTSLRSL